MATFSKNIELTFIEPPQTLVVDQENEDTFPVIKIDVSNSDTVIQALLLRILPLLKIESRELGAEYIFEMKE